MKHSRLAGFLTVFMAATFSAQAQQATPQSDGPKFPVGFILSRTPNIDGVYDPNEWTLFDTQSAGDAAISTYASWDTQNVYFAIKGPKLTSAIVYIDAKMDGVLNGADNYQITVTPLGADSVVDTKVYNSMAATPAAALTKAVMGAVVASTTTSEGTFIELAIPKRGLLLEKLEPNTKLAVSGGVTLAGTPAFAVPADPRAKMQILSMMDQMVSQNSLVSLDLRVKDRTVVPGQTLSLDFAAKNISGQPLVYKNYTIGGDPRIADLTNFLRVRGGTMAVKDGIKLGFSTDLPDTMPLGAYTMVSEMNLADGQSAQLLSSFEVVELLDLSLNTGSGPVTVVTERKIVVKIKNNKNKSVEGIVRLILPDALQTGLDKQQQSFRIQMEDGRETVEFKLTPKQTVAVGEYPVKAEIEAESFKKTLTDAILVGKK